jgi:hypothetical protein
MWRAGGVRVGPKLDPLALAHGGQQIVWKFNRPYLKPMCSANFVKNSKVWANAHFQLRLYYTLNS